MGDMEVVVTGIGPLLPNCADRQALWTQLRDGQSQLRFETVPGGGDRWPVGRIDPFEPDRWLARFPRAYYERYHREQQLYLASLVVGLDDARLALPAAGADAARVGIYDGTSRGNFDYWYERARGEDSQSPAARYTKRELLVGTPGQAANLAAGLLGVRGPVYTFNVTCCSGAVAIGHAFRDLLRGEIDVALATGHDSSLGPPVYHMYRDAGLLSAERDDPRRAVRPYGDLPGNAFGEGAVTLVLETRAHAERRGATILAAVAGFKYGNNGGHPLDVDREGGRVTSLMTDVLSEGGVARDDVGFVIGHGNGVAQSDRSEVAYVRRAFGARAGEVPLLSTKPIYGHLLGASSALNVAAAALMLHHGWLAPTVNAVAASDPAAVDPGPGGAPVVDHVAGRGRPCFAEAAMAVSYGIGGHNAVTLVRRAEAA
jgi:3-oxoacyl-[acyl-carrier-protein] synthase II